MEGLEIKWPENGQNFTEEELKENGIQSGEPEEEQDETEKKEPTTPTNGEPEGGASNKDENDNQEPDQGHGPGQIDESGNDQPPSDDNREEPSQNTLETQLSSLTEETGLEIGQIDDLKSILNEYNDLKKQVDESKDKNPLDSLQLSEATRKAVEYELGGGDVREYFRVNQIDAEKLSPKEALRQQFMMDNAELARDNPDHANRKFEREFNDKFGVLSKDPNDEDEDVDQWQYEFAKDELEYQGKQARQAIKDKQASFEPPEPPKKDDDNKPSEADIQKEIDNYNKKVDEFLKEFDAVGIPLDDENKEVFNLNLDDDLKSEVEKGLRNPMEGLKEHLGVDMETGNIDFEKLGPALGLILGYYNIGPNMAKQIKEKGEMNSIEKDLENPRPDNLQNGGEQAKDVADLLLEQHRARNNKGN